MCNHSFKEYNFFVNNKKALTLKQMFNILFLIKLYKKC